MLFDPARHEPLLHLEWDEARARDAIGRIVAAAERDWTPQGWWPVHPRDVEAGDDPQAPATPLYHGAGGVIWALAYLEARGAVAHARDYLAGAEALIEPNRAWLHAIGHDADASYLMGELPLLLLAQGAAPTAARADRLAQLIAGNVDNPARELMWGAPGTMQAALLLHGRTGEARWAELYRASADALWRQLRWSPEHQCRYWVQELYGRSSTYLDAVHGFVATASPLIRGRHLLDADGWRRWRECIVETVTRTATRSTDGSLANWRAELEPAGGAQKTLTQFCHGAPGFVICLADLPGDDLDALLVAAGETTWAAGPLAKGSNLCHGTGGNGYAFLALYRRTGDARCLARARAFAMHGIAQTDADAARYGRMRHSLWTGDTGFAIYLWDCLRATARFPTLDVYFGERDGAD